MTPGLPATLASPGITPGTPRASASNASDARGGGVRAAAAEDPLITDTRKLLETFVQLWKENKLEELVARYFTEDPLMLPWHLGRSERRLGSVTDTERVAGTPQNTHIYTYAPRSKLAFLSSNRWN